MKNEDFEEEEIKNYPIEEITWFDAQSSIHCFDIKEIKEELKPILSKSIGYLIHETKTYIVLGFLIFANDLIKHHQTIPKGMIQKRLVLTKKVNKKKNGKQKNN